MKLTSYYAIQDKSTKLIPQPKKLPASTAKKGTVAATKKSTGSSDDDSSSSEDSSESEEDNVSIRISFVH